MVGAQLQLLTSCQSLLQQADFPINGIVAVVMDLIRWGPLFACDAFPASLLRGKDCFQGGGVAGEAWWRALTNPLHCSLPCSAPSALHHLPVPVHTWFPEIQEMITLTAFASRRPYQREGPSWPDQLLCKVSSPSGKGKNCADGARAAFFVPIWVPLCIHLNSTHAICEYALSRCFFHTEVVGGGKGWRLGRGGASDKEIRQRCSLGS